LGSEFVSVTVPAASVVLDQLDTWPAVRGLHVRDIRDDILLPDNRFDPFPVEMGVRRPFETKQFAVEMHRPGKILNGILT